MAWSGLVFFAALQVFYLLYLVFDDWVSFRFLLPALPWALALQACAFAALCRVAPPRRRKAALVLTAILVASWRHPMASRVLLLARRRGPQPAGEVL